VRELDEHQKDDKRQGEAQSSTSNGGGGEARGPLRMRITAPDPELRERPVRRLFTADFKRRIVRDTDNLQPGEVAAFLRRHGLFHTQVRLWKEQIERGELEALSPKKPGRKPQDPELAAKQLAEKDREIRRLRERLAKAETIIEVQKKISEILSIPLNPPSNDEND
jgi:transposase